MPKGIRDLGDDVEKKIRQTLQSQLTRLDLVNREEFDVQTQVLLRTARSWPRWNSVWPSWRTVRRHNGLRKPPKSLRSKQCRITAARCGQP